MLNPNTGKTNVTDAQITACRRVLQQNGLDHWTLKPSPQDHGQDITLLQDPQESIRAIILPEEPETWLVRRPMFDYDAPAIHAQADQPDQALAQCLPALAAQPATTRPEQKEPAPTPQRNRRKKTSPPPAAARLF